MFRISEKPWLLGLFFILNLLTLFFGIDFFALFHFEASLANAGLALMEGGQSIHPEVSFLPSFMTAGGMLSAGTNEWGVRLPSLIAYVITCYFFFFWGRKVFGPDAVLLGLVFACSSFLFMFLGKFANADIWLLLSQTVILTVSIHYIKKKDFPLLGVIVLAGLIGALVSPGRQLLFLLPFFGILWWKHPEGKNVLLPFSISVGMSLIASVFIPIFPTGFLIGYNVSSLGVLLLGAMTIIGLIPPVFIHLWNKLREGEELAIISGAVLLGGLCSASLTFHFVLCFLAGKQFIGYFSKGYPYRNWVKVLTILQVIAFFFVGMYLMLTGFDWYRGEGFRKVLMFSISGWGFGIACAVGLFMGRHMTVLNCMSLGAVITSFLFWFQVFPLYEIERNYEKDIPTYITKQAELHPDLNGYQVTDELSSPVLDFYLEIQKDGLPQQNKTNQPYLTITSDSLNQGKQLEILRGRNGFSPILIRFMK